MINPTVEQAISFASLFEVVEVDHVCHCDNGCCLIVYEKGMDETAWRIGTAGTIEKFDRYGNVILAIEEEAAP